MNLSVLFLWTLSEREAGGRRSLPCRKGRRSAVHRMTKLNGAWREKRPGEREVFRHGDAFSRMKTHARVRRPLNASDKKRRGTRPRPWSALCYRDTRRTPMSFLRQ